MTSRRRSAGIGILLSSLLGATFVLTVAPRTSHAEQFVLFDALFTYTKMDADTGAPNKSHVYIRDRMGSEHPVFLVLNKSRPTNWMTPVDYRNGTVHIRTEVIEKPAGSEITQWTLCYIPNRGIGAGYGCTGSGTYREAGLYEQNVSMTSWWQNTALDWTQGILGMDLVMKDSDGGGGFTYLRPDFEKFFPTIMRITMIQVSAGATYDPTLVPGLDGGTVPVTDAGTGREGGGIADARSMDDTGAVGAGGARGSGGAGGAGGQSVGAGGQSTTGTGGSATGGQGTAGTQGGGAGPASTGTTSTTTAGGSGTTMGSPASDNAGGCSCSLARDERRPIDLGYIAVAALSAFWAGRRRRTRPS
jgi:MYXO-CTERM domain-containing protein